MEKKETYHILEDEKTTVLTKKQFNELLSKVREDVLKEVLGVEVDLRKNVLYSDGWGRMVVERILQKLSKLKDNK